MFKSPWATSLTRTGTINMKNRKPYRTASMKQAAKAKAEKTKGGFYVSTAPVLYHNS